MITTAEKFDQLQTRLLDHALACSAVDNRTGEDAPPVMHNYVTAMEIYQAMAPNGLVPSKEANDTRVFREHLTSLRREGPNPEKDRDVFFGYANENRAAFGKSNRNPPESTTTAAIAMWIVDSGRYQNFVAWMKEQQAPTAVVPAE